jgi:hypothetical protein
MEERSDILELKRYMKITEDFLRWYLFGLQG